VNSAGLRATGAIVRIEIPLSAGRASVLVRRGDSQTGRISGPGLTANWDEAGIDRFEFDFAGNEVRVLAVRAAEKWILLGTSTVDVLGRDGWYALAAALGTIYDGGVSVFERDVGW
jgi:hypothetical protein